MDSSILANEINHLTSSEFQRHLMADRATKLELMLAGNHFVVLHELIFEIFYLDEDRIREVTKSLSEIDSLARVIDGEQFQGITKSSIFVISLTILIIV